MRGGFRLTAVESYQITMAGLAATRVFAAGGAGGIALTAWALRRAGMPKRAVADQTLAFLVLTYGVYMAAVVVGGFGLYFGILPGSAGLGDHAAAGDHRPGRVRDRAAGVADADRPAAAPGRLRAAARPHRAPGPEGGEPAGGDLGGHPDLGLPRARG